MSNLPRSQSPTREEFDQWVSEALRRLYDSPALQSSPLTQLFMRDERDPLARGQRLRRLLLEAIRAMQPGKGTPTSTRDRRGYRLLELRYIEGAPLEDVMEQLGLSRAQYFREQAHVLEAVTAYVWERWQHDHSTVPPLVQDGPAEAGNDSIPGLVRSEAERLGALALNETIQPADLLEELRPFLEQLALAKGSSAQIIVQPMPEIRGSRVVLRQAVLLAAQAALAQPGIQELQITSCQEVSAYGFCVSAVLCGQIDAAAAASAAARKLADCEQLLRGIGGHLLVTAGSADEAPAHAPSWEARLLWERHVLHTLLVVDDNQGMADLFQRYLVGSSWRVVGARSGTEARRAIATELPTVIVLDVLIPEEDGWQLLTLLKADARTHDIPTIVCSVLSQPELAVTLGATAYLPKPVTQDALLAALRPWE
jgi:CheY-like chemotaxis protein